MPTLPDAGLDPYHSLAWGAHQYLQMQRPTLARLLEQTAAQAQVDTHDYMEAILFDEMPRAACQLPARHRVPFAASVCIEAALRDTHRHQ